MDVAIRAENVSKLYRLGETAERYNTLRDSLARAAGAPLRAIRRRLTGRTSERRRRAHEGDNLLWALRDVSFEVKRGEVLGIIGRNGAGKSTLLKVLSRITEPTAGSIDLYGRVASLLEVGTGFHQELTGRENIFLNGSILGMSHKEIRRKFDEIVAFAGVERFIDTPVKRYSSGMGVRLGFSVAAHLEAEILIIDEVLAVGDVEFQRKCLGKMDDVARSGRTVLFVSHNMATISNLCTEGMLMKEGRIQRCGRIEDVISDYLESTSATAATVDLAHGESEREGSGEVRFARLTLCDQDGSQGTQIRMGAGFTVHLDIHSKRDVSDISVALGLFSAQGARIAGMNSRDTSGMQFSFSKGERQRITCTVPAVNLMPGRYELNAVLQMGSNRSPVDRAVGALTFDIVPHDVYETGQLPRGSSILFFPDVAWNCTKARPTMSTISS